MDSFQSANVKKREGKSYRVKSSGIKKKKSVGEGIAFKKVDMGID